MGVLALLALRFALTTVALGTVWLFRRERVAPREWGVSVVLGIFQAVVLVLETYGVRHTSASNAGLIISLTIIFTPILDCVARRNWLPAPFFIATVVAIVGVGVLISSNGLHVPTSGDVMMLAAALVRSIHVT